MAQNDKKSSVPARKPSAKKKKGSFAKKLLLSVLLFSMACAAAVSVGLAWYVDKISADLPSEEEMLNYEANEASIVYDSKDRVVAELFIENRKPIKLDEVSKWMVMSILAAEDSAFYSHKGIRPLAIIRSVLSGDRGQGASTITQQLARNLFLTSEKSIERKAKEAIISLRLEKLYTKDRLLETYLNAIYFGHGAWGIDSAAHSYFEKAASELTLAESAALAGLVAAPEKYSPIRNLEASRSRQAYVLKRLVYLGWVTEEEAAAAATEELKFNEATAENKLVLNKAPYFVSHILFKELIPQFGSDRVYKGGLKIYTTLDLDLQEAAEEAVKDVKTECGLVSLDPNSGAVLALVGGKDFEKSKFNRVTQAYRQPGSTFKPLVYTTALAEGYLPTDHILDTPVTLEVKNSVDPIWSPKNFGDKYTGEETLLSALAHSHNVPTVRLTVMIGPEKIVQTARSMGITSPYLQPILSVGLGTANVTPLEMSVVYSAFANGGARISPYFIREIRDVGGDIIFSALPQQSEALKPETALMARAMLKEVVRAGTGAAAKIEGYEVFGKTGTTNDSTDAWFAGGVPELVTVVYVGNDDSTPMGKNATGSRIALPVWKAYMKKAVEIAKPPTKFTDTAPSVVPVVICTESGYASETCPKITRVFLPEGAATTSPCPLHAGGAGDDPNAPRLLLLDQDAETYQPAVPAVEEVKAPEAAPAPEPETAREEKPQETKREQPASGSGSWRDYIKKDDRPVEERYQDLLKKYNIKKKTGKK